MSSATGWCSPASSRSVASPAEHAKVLAEAALEIALKGVNDAAVVIDHKQDGV
jgi:hypothetical protein